MRSTAERDYGYGVRWRLSRCDNPAPFRGGTAFLRDLHLLQRSCDAVRVANRRSATIPTSVCVSPERPAFHPAGLSFNPSLLLLELLGEFPGELDGLIHLLRRHFLFERREIVSRIGIAVACGHIPPGMCPDCVPDCARA